MEGVNPEMAKEAMRLAAHKLPLKTSFVQRHDVQATVLRLLGIDHERLTYKFQGRYYRLTDVHGTVVKDILA